MAVKELKKLKPLVLQHKWAYTIGIACLLVTNAIQIIIPLVIKSAIDEIARPTPNLHNILLDAVKLVLLGLCILVGRFIWRQKILGSAYKIVTKVRMQLFSHLLKLSDKFFVNNKAGDLLSRATYDAEQLYWCLGWGLVSLADGLLISVSVLSVLLYYYGVKVLVVLIPLPLIALILGVASPIMGKYFGKLQKAFGSLSHVTQEILAGSYLIKAYHAEKSSLNKFADTNQNYIDLNVKLAKIQGLTWPSINYISGLTIVIMIYHGGRQVIQGLLSWGDFIAILNYAGMLLWPLMGAGFAFSMFQRGAAGLVRIHNVLNEKPDVIATENVPLPKESFASLRWQNVDFRYQDDLPLALSDINLELDKGQTLGIFGRIGSGKTTLINLIPRLFDSTHGSLCLNDQAIEKYKLEDLRSLFAIVSQSIFLFSDTIYNNIIFGNIEATPEEVDAVIEIAAIKKDIASFPHGLETIIGEKGVTLSGGQKQRIAIARALIVKAPILILDDALSACDSETSAEILSRLKETQSTKTTIIVSHRLDVIQHADKIIVLDEGQIAQRGTHQTLIQETGFYQDMYKIQG